MASKLEPHVDSQNVPQAHSSPVSNRSETSNNEDHDASMATSSPQNRHDSVINLPELPKQGRGDPPSGKLVPSLDNTVARVSRSSRGWTDNGSEDSDNDTNDGLGATLRSGVTYEAHILEKAEPRPGEDYSWCRVSKRQMPFESRQLIELVKAHRDQTGTSVMQDFALLSSNQQGVINQLLIDRATQKPRDSEWVLVDVQRLDKSRKRSHDVKKLQIVIKRLPKSSTTLQRNSQQSGEYLDLRDNVKSSKKKSKSTFDDELLLDDPLDLSNMHLPAVQQPPPLPDINYRQDPFPDTMAFRNAPGSSSRSGPPVFPDPQPLFLSGSEPPPRAVSSYQTDSRRTALSREARMDDLYAPISAPPAYSRSPSRAKHRRRAKRTKSARYDSPFPASDLDLSSANDDDAELSLPGRHTQHTTHDTVSSMQSEYPALKHRKQNHLATQQPPSRSRHVELCTQISGLGAKISQSRILADSTWLSSILASTTRGELMEILDELDNIMEPLIQKALSGTQHFGNAVKAIDSLSKEINDLVSIMQTREMADHRQTPPSEKEVKEESRQINGIVYVLRSYLEDLRATTHGYALLSDGARYAHSKTSREASSNSTACFYIIILAFITIASSTAFGVYYSVAKNDMGDGFTAAGFMLTIGGFPLGLWGAKHLGDCTCWKRWTSSSSSSTRRPPRERAATVKSGEEGTVTMGATTATIDEIRHWENTYRRN